MRGSGTTITPTEDQFVVAQVYKEGVTDQPGEGPDIAATLFYTVDDGVEMAAVMAYNTDIGNNDEYTGQIPAGHGCSTVEYYIKVVDTTDLAECYGNDQADNAPNFFLPITAVTAQDVLDVVRMAYAGPYVIGAVGPFEEGELAAYVA